MPGVQGTLHCQTCDRSYEVAGGIGADWHFEQFACAPCGTLKSVVVKSENKNPRAFCPQCRKRMKVWTAPVKDWPDIGGHEWVGGPCPGCAAPFAPEDLGSGGHYILWD